MNDRRSAGLSTAKIGWIDAQLLASALVGRLTLWTIDPALATLARTMRISYE